MLSLREHIAARTKLHSGLIPSTQPTTSLHELIDRVRFALALRGQLQVTLIAALDLGVLHERFHGIFKEKRVRGPEEPLHPERHIPD
jgi:hypothetical protein